MNPAESLPAGLADELLRLGYEPRIAQVGILVADLATSAQAFTSLVGLSPWSVYTYDSDLVSEMTYQGRPADFAMRIALSSTNPVVELVQPLRGPSIYEDWLRLNPPGLHHIAVEVPSFAEGVKRAAATGVDVLQSGRGYGLDRDGGFAYLDTYERSGVIIELLEIPARRRDPEAVWS
jgi:methylmalonyl-CoA/ethylmalonyl-CoA epimerase